MQDSAAAELNDAIEALSMTPDRGRPYPSSEGREHRQAHHRSA
jgi:hypothetical protein